MKKDELSKILAQYGTLYKDFTLTPLSIEAWFSLFEKESVDIFCKAFQEACREDRYGFPTPGDVQFVINKTTQAIHWSPEKAWEKALAVVDYVRLKGHLANEAKAKFNEGNQRPFWLTMNNKSLYKRIYDIFIAPKTAWGKSYTLAEEGYIKRDFIAEYKNNLETTSLKQVAKKILSAPELKLLDISERSDPGREDDPLF